MVREVGVEHTCTTGSTEQCKVLWVVGVPWLGTTMRMMRTTRTMKSCRDVIECQYVVVCWDIQMVVRGKRRISLHWIWWDIQVQTRSHFHHPQQHPTTTKKMTMMMMKTTMMRKQRLNLHSSPNVHGFSLQWHEIVHSNHARPLLHDDVDGSNQPTCILR